MGTKQVLVVLLVACSSVWCLPAEIREKRFFIPQLVVDQCDPAVENRTSAADPFNCQVFYLCDHGWPKMEICPGNSIYSPELVRCENPENAQNDVCGYQAPALFIDGDETIDKAQEGCEFYCDDGNCIAYRGVCDGQPQCDDGSDENDCAAPCTSDNCRLPNCRCASTDIPGGLLPSEVPQAVMLTFDESVRVEDYAHLYQQIFKRITPARRRERRLNPNGCPMAGTFFVDHQFTDYMAVQSLYSEGHEIASHTITSTFDLYAKEWAEQGENRWLNEVGPQRQMYERFANVDPATVTGARAPYIQPGGNSQMQAILDAGYQYDSSLTTTQMNPPLFPFTLTHQYLGEAGCVVKPCPTRSFPELWEVPLVTWLDTNDTLCSVVDACYFPNDKEEAKELLNSNFRRHYETNRSPFFLALRSRWFYEAQYNLEALEEFIDELLDLGDVYFVTISQALKWMQNPTKLSDIDNFDGWACDTERPAVCEHANLCGYYNITHRPNSEDHPGDRFFQTCNDCPVEYPWLGNPMGDGL